MGKAHQEALVHRYNRDKSALKAAKAAFRDLVQKRRRAIHKKWLVARKARAAVEAAGLEAGSDVSDVDAGADLGEDEAVVEAPDAQAPEVAEGSGSSQGSDTSSEEGPAADPVVPVAVPVPPARRRPRKKPDGPPVPKAAPSPRRVPNSAGVLYPGYPQGHPSRCSACEQLLGGRLNATAKHLELCEWRARKGAGPKAKPAPRPAA